MYDNETPQERAHREARRAIEYAHMMTEIVGQLVADMQQAGVLRPSAKTEILRILREGYDPNRSEQAMQRLQQRMNSTTFLEQELKRETPRQQE